MVEVRKCPKCGRYMRSYIQYSFCGYALIYDCECGYSTQYETTEATANTTINENQSLRCSNHT